MSAVYDCSKRDSRADGLAAAAGAVRSSRLVVLPTDTVYGIGADAFDAGAVQALLRAKNRGPDMPVEPKAASKAGGTAERRSSSTRRPRSS